MIYHAYPDVFSFIRKLSSGRYDIHPPDHPGRIQDFVPCLSLKNIFFIELPSIFWALSISKLDDGSIPSRSSAVSQVIFFISVRVEFLYSGIIKKRNFGSTFLIAIER